MAGIEEHELTVTAQDAKEHGGIAAHFRVLAQKPIHVIEHHHRVRSAGHAGKRALEHGRDQRRAEPFAGHVRNKEGRPVLTHWKYIEVITAHGMTRRVRSRHRKVRVIAKSSRKQSLLNVPCDVELLLHSLPLAFAFYEARV